MPTLGFIDKFSGGSSLYAAARPTYPDALFATLASLAPGRGLAWDSGTGNGQAARALAQHFDAVYATDPSADQIAAAEPAPGVTFAVGAAERCKLPDRSADLITAATALHWFDLDAFYAEVVRVAKPGGVLAAFAYSWFHVAPDVDAAVRDRLLPALAPHWAANNAICWRGYRDIPFPGEELQLGPFALHLSWALPELIAFVETWSATRALIAEEGRAPLDAALEPIATAWGEANTKRSIVMPLHVRAARLS